MLKYMQKKKKKNKKKESSGMIVPVEETDTLYCCFTVAICISVHTGTGGR